MTRLRPSLISPADPGERGTGRPFTRLATAGVAAHVFFELAAGVGMPAASLLGPFAAAGVAAAVTGTAWRAAARQPGSRSDAGLALWNGLSLAAVVAHLKAWPRHRLLLGLPWLDDCEGLGPELMRYYNPILYLSAGAALVGAVRENEQAPGLLPLLPLGLVPVLIDLQHREHCRLLEQARRQPGWWNRRLQKRLHEHEVPGASCSDQARWSSA